MEKSEYERMFNLESDFWWYVILHELVDYTIGKNKQEGVIKILDAGCGTGRMMEILQKYGRIYGIDYSEDAVAFTKKRGIEEVVTGDLNDYHFENDSFHAIICLDVLYHSGIKDDLSVVRNLHGALKPGGILIINLPAFEYLKRPHDTVVHTRKRYRKKEFTAQIKEAGFSVINASYRLPLLYLFILISEVFRWGENPEKSASDLKKIPGWLNSLLLLMGRIENCLLKTGICFPVGSSLFIVAKKKSAL